MPTLQMSEPNAPKHIRDRELPSWQFKQTKEEILTPWMDATYSIATHTLSALATRPASRLTFLNELAWAHLAPGSSHTS